MLQNNKTMKQLKSASTKGVLMGIIMILAVSLFFTSCNNNNKTNDAPAAGTKDTTVVVAAPAVHDTTVVHDTAQAK